MKDHREKQRGRLLPWVTAAILAVLGVGMLRDAAAMAAGVRRGLAVCGSVLIPSLFPFMVLCTLLAAGDGARVLSFPLRPVTTRVLKLPADLGAVVLLSLVGGYPVGAKMIASLLEQKRIDRKTAERMLCFCVNAGPSFLISAVGTGLLFSRRAGLLLFFVQTATTLLLGWIISLRVRRPTAPAAAAAPTEKGSAVLVQAVQGSVSAILTMCGFAILFSGLLALLEAWGTVEGVAALLGIRETVVRAGISGLLEVTAGCMAAVEVGGKLSIGLLAATISFGGLSVLFQVFSCFPAKAVRFRPLVVARLAHAGISTLLMVPLYEHFCGTTSVWASGQPPLLQLDRKTTLLSVCLLGMCTIFTLSLGEWNNRPCRRCKKSRHSLQ